MIQIKRNIHRHFDCHCFDGDYLILLQAGSINPYLFFLLFIAFNLSTFMTKKMKYRYMNFRI